MSILSQRAESNGVPADLRRRIISAPQGYALFLDLDGTLLDIAERPEDVVVADGLVEDLDRLREGLAGALAIVSGRALADIDRVLEPMRFDAAAEHGATIRFFDGESSLSLAESIDPGLAEAVEAAVRPFEGVRVERKRSALAVHFRAAPRSATRLAETLADILARSRANLRLLAGRCVLEIAPALSSKARAVEVFLSSFPFAGRRPVFVGDDVSDEEACVFVRRSGGVALAVAGEYFAPERAAFGSPREVRRWIAALSAGLGGAGGDLRR